MTLAEIAGQSNPLLYMPLFVLTFSTPNYIVSVDNNCAWNYHGNQRTLDFPSINNPNAQECTVQAINPASPNSYAWLQLLKTYDNATNDCRLESITDEVADTKGTVETYTDTNGNPITAMYIQKTH